jgi:hypothetical protein
VRVEVELAPDAITAFVEEVMRRVLVELGTQRSEGRWLCGAAAAAAYLGCSPKRVYARLHEIPHVREGGRLMFHTNLLDDWLLSL